MIYSINVTISIVLTLLKKASPLSSITRKKSPAPIKDAGDAEQHYAFCPNTLDEFISDSVLSDSEHAVLASSLDEDIDVFDDAVPLSAMLDESSPELSLSTLAEELDESEILSCCD